MDGLLGALGHLHGISILHRDVKPENLLLHAGGRPVLGDFGLACGAEDAQEARRRIGSPGFIAPEVLKGQGATGKADVFSAGATLYFACMGTTPFNSKDMASTLHKTLTENISFQSQAGRLSPVCRKFAESLLTKRPQDRPTALEAMADPWFSGDTNSASKLIPASAPQPVAPPARPISAQGVLLRLMYSTSESESEWSFARRGEGTDSQESERQDPLPPRPPRARASTTSPAPSPASPAPSPASPAPTTQTASEDLPSLRFYVVWRVAGRSDLRGIHISVDRGGWHRLRRQLPNEEYLPRTCSLRRADTILGAVALYHTERLRGWAWNCGRGRSAMHGGGSAGGHERSSMTVSIGDTKMVFLRLETTCLRLEKPTGWAQVVALSPWPKGRDVITAFNGLDGLAPPGESSDELRAVVPKALAVPVTGQAPASTRAGQPSDGAKGHLEHRRACGDKGRIQRERGLADGSLSFQDVLMAKILQDMSQKDQSNKKKKDNGDDSGSGSDSDLDGTLLKKGLSSMKNMSRLKKRIRSRPKRVWKKFEENVKEELGVAEGEPWTLRSWSRRINWGKFRGLRRCMEMMIAIYELLKADSPEIARAQAVQNMKAIHQSVLSGGDWATAWLLTGLTDPTQRREFAGEEGEMSAITGYLGWPTSRRRIVEEKSTKVRARTRRRMPMERAVQPRPTVESAAALDDKDRLWKQQHFVGFSELFGKAEQHVIPPMGRRRAVAHLPGEDDVLMARAEAAYEVAGFPRSEAKDFRNQLNFKAWGAEVRGGLGTSGGPLAVRRECWALTRHILKFGWVCKKIMQQLLGIFASLLIYRREFFSAFHSIYAFCDALPEVGWSRLSGPIGDELRAVCMLLPFMESDLRRPVGDVLWATDATPTVGGATEVTVDSELCQLLYAYAEQRGEHVRLDWTGNELPSERLAAPAAEIDQLVKSVAHGGKFVSVTAEFVSAVIRRTARVEVPASPPPKCPPGWAKRWFPCTPQNRWGLELFAGSCRLTSAFRALGLPVLDPVELSMGGDVFSDLVEQLIRSNQIGWIWSGPPCGSFSALRNLDPGGPLRPKGQPEGDSSNPVVLLGNRLWHRNLFLITLAWKQGAHFIIEYPEKSKAWQLGWTQKFMQALELVWLPPIPLSFAIRSRLPTLSGSLRPPSSDFITDKDKQRRLRERLHSAAYTLRLGDGLQRVNFFLGAKGHRSLECLGAQPKLLDKVLEEYVDHCFAELESRQATVEAILSVQKHCRVTRQALPCTWEACWSWRMLQPLQTRRPMPPSVLGALVVVAFAMGLNCTGRIRAQWWSASVLWRVAFDGLLRRDMGKRQFVQVKDPATVEWLRWLVTPLAGSQKLFPGSRETMVKLFKVACNVLWLQDAGLTLASFRTGGATTHFQREQNLGVLQFYGRWRTPVTLQHYLQEALSAYLLMDYPCLLRSLHADDYSTSASTSLSYPSLDYHIVNFDSTLGYPGEGPRDSRIRLDEVRQLDGTILSDTGPQGGLTFVEAYRYREFSERASKWRRADPNHMAFAKYCKVRMLAGVQLLEPLADPGEPPAAEEAQLVVSSQQTASNNFLPAVFRLLVERRYEQAFPSPSEI
ncbi:unnamed protein product [Polarella glacialis]|uniref:Protein kinase domain-containing protein n=1 Tax=Polarella glacialis TaxID=89957 RepID=A0A813JZF7_POLGL|nr:unnamed protein product [Polarella glacialis]